MSKWSLICSAVDKRQQSSGYALINAVSFLITLNHLPQQHNDFFYLLTSNLVLFTHVGTCACGHPPPLRRWFLVCLFQHNSNFYPRSHVVCIVTASFLISLDFSARKLKEWNNIRNFKTAEYVGIQSDTMQNNSLQIIIVIFQVRGHF